MSWTTCKHTKMSVLHLLLVLSDRSNQHWNTENFVQLQTCIMSITNHIRHQLPGYVYNYLFFLLFRSSSGDAKLTNMHSIISPAKVPTSNNDSAQYCAPYAYMYTCIYMCLCVRSSHKQYTNDNHLVVI